MKSSQRKLGRLLVVKALATQVTGLERGSKLPWQPTVTPSSEGGDRRSQSKLATETSHVGKSKTIDQRTTFQISTWSFCMNVDTSTHTDTQRKHMAKELGVGHGTIPACGRWKSRSSSLSYGVNLRPFGLHETIFLQPWERKGRERREGKMDEASFPFFFHSNPLRTKQIQIQGRIALFYVPHSHPTAEDGTKGLMLARQTQNSTVFCKRHIGGSGKNSEYLSANGLRLNVLPALF